MMRFASIPILILFLIPIPIPTASLGADEPKFTARVIDAAPPTEVSGEIGKLLSGGAIEVRDGAGAIATFWLRQSLPTKATPEQIRNGLTYEEIGGGSIVGAVRFAGTWTDFRSQEVVAGVYTLRIAVQPTTGDHTGTAPHTDFCLLTPASKDTDPAAIELKALVERSKGVTGGTHPSVMLLFPHHKGDATTVTEEKNNISVLRTRLTVDGGEGKTKLGFGFVIAGTAER